MPPDSRPLPQSLPSPDYLGVYLKSGVVIGSIGLILWLPLAASTWDLDHALGGFCIECGFVNIGLFAAFCLNGWLVILTWLRTRSFKTFRPFWPVYLVNGLWIGAVILDFWVMSIYVKEADEALRATGFKEQ